MAVIGNRQDPSKLGKGYSKDPLRKLATSFLEVMQSVQNESGSQYLFNPQQTLSVRSNLEALKQWFVENSVDRNDVTMTNEDCMDQLEMMSEQFINDVQAMNEYAPMVGYNPVIGMSLPIHKNILLNNIFDKGAIPKVVAREPKFTISLETRILKDTQGNEIDMWKDQNKMTDAILATAPMKDTVLKLPESGQTDVLTTTFGVNALDANLSIESAITAVLAQSYVAVGDKFYDEATKTDKVAATGDVGLKPVWFPIRAVAFVPGYGEYDRQLMGGFEITVKKDATTTEVVKGTLMGYTQKNRFSVNCDNAKVTSVKLSARIDTSSAAIRTCSVDWRVRTDIVEIPNAIPLNVPISPEEVKDVSALYNINQLTKVMSLIKTVLGNYKDDLILRALNTSFMTMPTSQKVASAFDFSPRQGYAWDHVTWRHTTFMDYLDTMVTTLLQVLNDPNMVVSVFGRPDLIRKITPTEYTYVTPSSIGPVELDFTKTVVTSDKRVYQFISSDKLRDTNTLIIVLCPRNSDRIVYRIYDYQMYISNEIRNSANPALPAIHAFERFKFVEYQPVQGRINVINPTGLRYHPEDKAGSYVEQGGRNDYTANKPTIDTPHA